MILEARLQDYVRAAGQVDKTNVVDKRDIIVARPADRQRIEESAKLRHAVRASRHFAVDHIKDARERDDEPRPEEKAPGKEDCGENIHDESKNYFLARSGNDWWSNGTKIDSGTVSALVDKIRELSASKFAETGFAASALDVTVTSDGGKRVEKVMIAKNGDDFLAKRENEPALYVLNASAITELQKSAADLKPAPSPTKK